VHGLDHGAFINHHVEPLFSSSINARVVRALLLVMEMGRIPVFSVQQYELVARGSGSGVYIVHSGHYTHSLQRV
jgi:hypothetical protein